jgi:hypothetical protein
MRKMAEVEYKDRTGKALPGTVGAAIETYFAVNIDEYEQRDGTTDWEGFFDAQDAALKGLSSTDKKAVNEWLRKFDTPTVTQFRKAQNVVDRFYDKPKYKGLSLEEGEEVDRILFEVAPKMQLQYLRANGEELERADAIMASANLIRDPDAARFLSHGDSSGKSGLTEQVLP